MPGCYHHSDVSADPEEPSVSLSGSPPPTGHVTSAERTKDATSTVHVATTASAAAAVSSAGTVQSPPAASRSV